MKNTRLRTATTIVLGAIAWEVLPRVIHSPLVLVPLSSVFQSLLRLALSGDLLKHVQVSGMEFAWGFGLAVLIGVGLGSLMAIFEPLEAYLRVVVSSLYSTPTVALAPLFIIWFGIGIGSKVAVIFLVAVFPIIINTMVGIRSADHDLVETARAFSASKWDTFANVMLPSALPSVVAGLRLGVGRGLVGIVVAELFGSRAGLGYLIAASGQVLDTAGLLAGVLVLAGTGVIVMELLQRFEERMAPWRIRTDSW